MIKITIEGWEEEPIIKENIKEFMLLIIGENGDYLEAINAGAAQCLYFARRLGIRADADILDIYRKAGIIPENKED